MISLREIPLLAQQKGSLQSLKLYMRTEHAQMDHVRMFMRVKKIMLDDEKKGPGSDITH